MTSEIGNFALIQGGNNLPFAVYDSHTHVWESNSIPTRSARFSTLETPGSAECLLKLMDEKNVITSLAITPMTLGFDNSISLEIAERYPSRFLPIVRIDLNSANYLESFRDLCGQGAKGLRINLHHLDSANFLLDERFSKLWLFLESSQLPLFVHCEASQFHFISSISSQHQKIKIIIDHTGRITSDDGIHSTKFMDLLNLSQLPNVYIKVSSTNFFANVPDTHSDMSDLVAAILREFTADRILWGSDWPFSENDGTYASSFEPFLSMKLENREEILKKVFSDNFKEIFQCI